MHMYGKLLTLKEIQESVRRRRFDACSKWNVLKCVLYGRKILHKNEMLCSMSWNGNVWMVRLLLRYGADDLNGACASAASAGHVRLVQYLLRQGATDRHRVLLAAMRNGQLKVILSMQENRLSTERKFIENIGQ